MYTVRKEIFEHRVDRSDMINYIQVCNCIVPMSLQTLLEKNSYICMYVHNRRCIKNMFAHLRQTFFTIVLFHIVLLLRATFLNG